MTIENTQVDSTNRGKTKAEEQEFLRSRIKEERERRGWSYAKLAAEVTGHTGVLMLKHIPYSIEEQGLEVTMSELVAMADVFGLTTEQLLPPVDNEFENTLDGQDLQIIAKGLFKALAVRGDAPFDNNEYWLELATTLGPFVSEVRTRALTEERQKIVAKQDRPTPSRRTKPRAKASHRLKSV